ncbi:MAG: hypothetical protein E6J91_09845 [Deltaproteobacteria bacterium]|nr:MAG: hypothetical protein E6J91_09845 [Deltaproteobacteria bacterium]
MRHLPALAFALAATGAPAHADPTPNELSFGGTARALRSSSANALTADNLAGITLGAARDLGILDGGPLPGLSLWAEAGLAATSADGTMFQSLSTSIGQLGLTGGVAARYQLHRMVAASARLALGAQRANVSISDPTGASASDHGWGAMAQAGAALDLVVSTAHQFGLGVRLELGYVAARGIALTPRRSHPDDTLALPMTELPLGRLDLSGPTLSLSVLGQF